jgi:hypothetical protein
MFLKRKKKITLFFFLEEAQLPTEILLEASSVVYSAVRQQKYLCNSMTLRDTWRAVRLEQKM